MLRSDPDRRRKTGRTASCRPVNARARRPRPRTVGGGSRAPRRGLSALDLLLLAFAGRRLATGQRRRRKPGPCRPPPSLGPPPERPSWLAYPRAVWDRCPRELRRCPLRCRRRRLLALPQHRTRSSFRAHRVRRGRSGSLRPLHPRVPGVRAPPGYPSGPAGLVDRQEAVHGRSPSSAAIGS